MSKAPKSAISKLRFTLDKSSEFSRATKTMLTLIGPSLEMYKGPGIQILGTISAFINQRLVEIVKPTDYADWRVTRFQQSGRQDWLEYSADLSRAGSWDFRVSPRPAL